MFELVWEDDRFEIEQMVTNVRKMIEEDERLGIRRNRRFSQAIPSTLPGHRRAQEPRCGARSHRPTRTSKQVYLTNGDPYRPGSGVHRLLR